MLIRARRKVGLVRAHKKPSPRGWRPGKSAIGIWQNSAAASSALLNAYWKVRSFRNYADYALTEPFASGLAQLREQGSQRRDLDVGRERPWARSPRLDLPNAKDNSELIYYCI